MGSSEADEDQLLKSFLAEVSETERDNEVLRSFPPSLPHRPYGGFISLRITVARYVASDPIRFPLLVPSVQPSICSNRLGAKFR